MAKKKRSRVSLYVSEKTKKWLDKTSKENDVSKPFIINKVLQEYIEYEGEVAGN